MTGGTLLRRAFVVVCVMLAVTVGIVATWMWHERDRVLHSPMRLERTLIYEVPRGAALSRVAHDLARRGVLEQPWWLEWQARSRGLDSAIKAGEYAIKPGTTPLGLLALLVSGRTVQHALTLVDGWTFREMMAAVRANPYLEHTLTGLDGAEIMRRIGHPGVAPEGRFFPDTYHFPRGTTDVEFLRRAAGAMDRYLTKAWQGRDPGLPLHSPEEALVLASIVEKETAVPAERPRIAGVFVRRLEKGMRLESDPTVIYGLGTAFDGNLTRKELHTDTPYNTYTRHGLPPTPIALPAAAAIDAVLHPQSGSSLYFVARGDGTHQFSATYAEHQRAVARYQLHRARRKAVATGN